MANVLKLFFYSMRCCGRMIPPQARDKHTDTLFFSRTCPLTRLVTCRCAAHPLPRPPPSWWGWRWWGVAGRGAGRRRCVGRCSVLLYLGASPWTLPGESPRRACPRRHATFPSLQLTSRAVIRAPCRAPSQCNSVTKRETKKVHQWETDP